jgi:hypothetical protein
VIVSSCSKLCLHTDSYVEDGNAIIMIDAATQLPSFSRSRVKVSFQNEAPKENA